MTELHITHSATEGTLIEGTARGDGSAQVLKTHRWRWSRTLGAWYIPRSRDAQPDLRRIEATRDDLEGVGFTVAVTIDRGHRSTAEVETDRAERAQARAEALAEKAAQADAAAAGAEQDYRAALEVLPPFGQPILMGHHSESRHRRQIEKARRRVEQAIDAGQHATRAHDRAQVADRATDRRYAPVTVANRIAALEAEARSLQRRLDGYTRTLFTRADGIREVETTAPATGERREYCRQQLEAVTDQLAYWRSVRAEQITAGEATGYSRDTVAAGDTIRYRGQWYTVTRANAKTATVPSPFAGTWRIPWAEVQDHRPAERSEVTGHRPAEATDQGD